MKLAKNEIILAVVPEYASGPGWANAVIWVYIRDTATGKVRDECIQPDQRTPELNTLFAIGATVCDALRKAAKGYFKEGK